MKLLKSDEVGCRSFYIFLGDFRAMLSMRMGHYIIVVIIISRVSVFKLGRVYICVVPTADAVVTI